MILNFKYRDDSIQFMMEFTGLKTKLTLVLNRLLRWFLKTPKLDNISDQLTAQVLDRFILTVVFVMVPLSSFLFVITPGIRQNLYIGLFGCAALLCLRIPLKKGRLTFVGIVLAAMFVIFPTMMLYFIGTIRNVFTGFYFISIIISAFLLNSRMSFLFSGLSFVGCLGLFLLELAGKLPQQSSPSAANQFTLFTIVLVLTTIIFQMENINRQKLKIILSRLQSELTKRKETEEALSHTALHDALTQLPNRSLLKNRVDLSIKQLKRYPDRGFALLYLDLDRFKVINDSLGHSVGDKLLISFANSLQILLRDIDVAARLGGDEFVILLNDISDYKHAIIIANRILDNLSRPILIDGKSLSVGTSIGIAFSNSDYNSADEILRDADIAMYQSKETGKNKFTIFDDEIQKQALFRLELENDFHLALENQEFVLNYQPILDLQNNTIAGFEALVRWQHPEKGLISPTIFIPIAEETGIIQKLNLFIMQSAARQFQIWKDNKLLSETTYLSVNISAICLEIPDYAHRLSSMMQDVGFNPAHLTIELTEGVLIDNLDRNIKVLEELQTQGINISIDDFGTGYSSLSYLHKLPLDNMKIDKSFVMGMDQDSKNQNIIETIITLGNSLDMQLIAEGIETVEQLKKLKELNCKYGQGFLFSKALAAAEIPNYITMLSTQNIIPEQITNKHLLSKHLI